MTSDPQPTLPCRFAHLVDIPTFGEHVVIAETTSLSGPGMHGMRELTTGLVPLNRLSRVLGGNGRQGWLRKKFTDGPVHRKGRVIHEPFALVTPDGLPVEALVEGWTNHNIVIAVPQNRLLATYGLQPRMIESDQSIRWDDPEHITYDVVIVRPYSKYLLPDEFTRSEVLLRSDYAHDYSGLRGRAIVAVYYEQQSVAVDDELETLLGSEEYRRIDLPGIGIEVKRTSLDAEYPLFIAAWGCRLLVKPDGTLPITDDEKPTLVWPGVGVVSRSSDFTFSNSLEQIYVRDEVLVKFERDEFDVHPKHGSVSYEGRWAMGYAHRVSRDYIAYELRKLYEGCPRAVIAHVHEYVVDRAEADAQRASLGSANIGSRAARVIRAYCALQSELRATATAVDLVMDQVAIATPTPDEVEYSGWWTFDEFRPLGRVAPQAMNQDAFLDRAATLYAPFETLKEKPLREIVHAAGVPAAAISGFRSLKLLATLAQLATVATNTGLTLRSDRSEIAERWNAAVKLPELRLLFALNDLRQLASHAARTNAKTTLKDALAVFGVDVATVTGGWGPVLDTVYDGVASTLEHVVAILKSAR